MGAPSVHIGTSGWNYESFLGRLYPPGTPKRRFLETYARLLDTVELNASFYRSFPDSTWNGWHDRTPTGFLWSVKVSRYITHIKRLKVERESIKKFWHSARLLSEKLAVCLFQLPPSLKYERDLLIRFLDLLPHEINAAFEARHVSWHCDEVWKIFKERNITWVVSDTAGRYPMSLKTTSDTAYIRLHGPRSLYHGSYGEESLMGCKETIVNWGRNTFIYFDNTDDGSAALDALTMKRLFSEDTAGQ